MQSFAKETKEVVLNLHVKRVMIERASNNGKVSSGFMKEIVESLKSQGLPSATRHTVHNHENKLQLLQRRGEEVPYFVCINDDAGSSITSTASPVSAVTEATGTATAEANKGGRPKGSPTVAKKTAQKNFNIAVEEAATLIIEKRKDAKSNGKAVAKGVISTIIQATNDKCSTGTTNQPPLCGGPLGCVCARANFLICTVNNTVPAQTQVSPATLATVFTSHLHPRTP